MVDGFDEVFINFTVRIRQVDIPGMKDKLGFHLVSRGGKKEWIDIDKVEILMKHRWTGSC